jgi:hypothetical protein
MKNPSSTKPVQPFGLQFLEVPAEDLTEVDGGSRGCRRPKPTSGGFVSHMISMPLAGHRCPDYS